MQHVSIREYRYKICDGLTTEFSIVIVVLGALVMKEPMNNACANQEFRFSDPFRIEHYFQSVLTLMTFSIEDYDNYWCLFLLLDRVYEHGLRIHNIQLPTSNKQSPHLRQFSRLYQMPLWLWHC